MEWCILAFLCFDVVPHNILESLCPRVGEKVREKGCPRPPHMRDVLCQPELGMLVIGDQLSGTSE